MDDQPTVIMPLQFVPMIENRRTGPISYRTYAIATGEVKPREGEAVIDRAAIDKAIAETDLAGLIEQRQHFETLNEATNDRSAASGWSSDSLALPPRSNG